MHLALLICVFIETEDVSQPILERHECFLRLMIRIATLFTTVIILLLTAMTLCSHCFLYIKCHFYLHHLENNDNSLSYLLLDHESS